MKARVFRVYKDNRHKVEYHYVNTAKFHDDVEAWYQCSIRTPMMDIRIFKDDDSLESSTICTYASPELLKRYTGFDIFDAEYTFFIEGVVLDIEFEWVQQEYPYLESPKYRDRIVADKIHFPKISKIEEVVLDW